MLLQNNPEGYHADSKVNEGVLGPELWNAAQVTALSIRFHHPPGFACWFSLFLHHRRTFK